MYFLVKHIVDNNLSNSGLVLPQIHLIEGEKMIIELPLETWSELFGFVPRSQLIKLVPHFGERRKRDSRGRKCQETIGDRQFVSFVQFFLHKCGEITLGDLFISPSENENEPIVIANENDRMPLALADVPIPENVKNFKSIRISNFFGEPVIDFLRFPANQCENVLDRLQTEYSELATHMLTTARVLIAEYNCRDFWFCDWLHIPRDDGKPRALFLYGENMDGFSLSHSYFIKHIKKDFLEANQAVSFFIKLDEFRDQASVQSLILENSQTREKLVIKGASGNYKFVTISRYPIGINEEEWVEEMTQHSNVDYGTIDRKIEFQPYGDDEE